MAHPGYVKHYEERIKHRFSLKRMKEVVDSLTDVQKGFLRKHGFEKILDISAFFVPIPFLEWVMDHLIVGVAEFVHKKKSIRFTKAMVQQVLGIPSGNLPVKLSADSDEVSHKLSRLRSRFLVGDKASISHAISLLYGDEIEDSFMRSFMLILLATVLCPSTQNSVNLNYLHSLLDISQIQKYDWCGHILNYILSEVNRYHKKIESDAMLGGKSFYFGSCLPLLAIVYMDFLDLHRFDESSHQINYAIPRICNICQADFNFILDVDRNKSSFGQHDYGVISFRHLSSTPYGTGSVASCEANHSDNEKSGQHSESTDSSSCSLTFDVDSSILPVVKRHCALLTKEFSDEILSSETISTGIAKHMAPIFANRLSLMSVDICSQVLSVSSNANIRTPAADTHANDIVVSPASACPTIHDDSECQLHDTPSNVGIAVFDHELAINNVFSCATGTEPLSVLPPEPNLTSINRTGSSTILKRKRKKRHVIIFNDDSDEPVMIHIDGSVEELYNKYVYKQFVKTKRSDPSPAFISISGFECSYQTFRSSLRPRGFVSCEVMSLYVQMFNHEHKHFSDSALSRCKIAFTDHFSFKLAEDTKYFNPASVEGELTRINSEMPISHADMLLFPCCINDHWFLVCINILHNEVNVLDGGSTALSSRVRDEIVRNMVTNLERACKEAEIVDKNFSAYRKIMPHCPRLLSSLPSYKNDSGVFVMLYMEHFNSQDIKKFDHELADDFRKLLAYKLITSSLNEIDSSKVE